MKTEAARTGQFFFTTFSMTKGDRDASKQAQYTNAKGETILDG
jgi:hypothetical protein